MAVKDSNGLSDPYCELYVLDDKLQVDKKTKQKTKVIKKNLNPKWNETFTFQVPVTSKGIMIDMFDEDLIGSDEFMGTVTVLPGMFQMDQEVWLPLNKKSATDEVKGDICIKFMLKK